MLVEHRVAIPGEHELTEVRVLDDDELTEIRKAADLIVAVASSPAFRRLQQLTQLMLARIDQVEAREKPAVQDIESCLAGVSALVQAEAVFVESVKKLLEDAGDDDAAEAGQRVDLLEESSAWEMLDRASRGEARLARDRSGAVGALHKDTEFYSTV